jgi:hypothetical protein
MIRPAFTVTENVALGMRTQQKGTERFGAASLAVDGSTEQYHTCAHALDRQDPYTVWWYVDLMDTSYQIHEIRLYFKSDCKYL